MSFAVMSVSLDPQLFTETTKGDGGGDGAQEEKSLQETKRAVHPNCVPSLTSGLPSATPSSLCGVCVVLRFCAPHPHPGLLGWRVV